MAYQLSDIISEAQSKIGDASFAQGDLINYANNTNRDIHTKHMLSYMESVVDYTSAGLDVLGTLPADLLEVNNLRLTDKQFAQKLQWLTADQFDSRYPQPTLTAPGVPYVAYAWGRVIRLFPTPMTNPSGLTGFGSELRYWKKPTKLSATTDVPDVPEEFREVLLLGVLRQAYERRQRFDVSQLLDQQYQSKLVDLVDVYGSGMLQEADPYMQV